MSHRFDYNNATETLGAVCHGESFHFVDQVVVVVIEETVNVLTITVLNLVGKSVIQIPDAVETVTFINAAVTSGVSKHLNNDNNKKNVLAFSEIIKMLILGNDKKPSIAIGSNE